MLIVSAGAVDLLEVIEPMSSLNTEVMLTGEDKGTAVKGTGALVSSLFNDSLRCFTA